MKDKNKVLAKVVCAVMSMMLFTGVAACTGTENKPLVFDNQGIYYTEVDGHEYQFTINDKTFELVLDGETYSGTYSFDGKKLNLTFDDSKGTGTVTYTDGTVTIDYDGKQYVMVKKIEYTVTYDVDGGSAVASETVFNGQKATRPQDPAKDGCIFVGWYKDAAHTQAFDFEKEVITANTTVYAYFVENNPVGEEFEVKFELGYEGEALAPVKTVGGKLVNLPAPERDGYKFVGWWLSDFEDAAKLTCQYTNQQLLRASTLYAVWEGEGTAVSVNEKTISWISKGVNLNYEVKVYDSEDKELYTRRVSSTSLDYDFAALDAGEYKVTVTVRGVTAEAYYLNKALAAVSHFEVEEPGLLKFTAVPNATKYRITVVCGDFGHSHVDIDLGTKTEFDFSNCEMAPEGITFVVKAYADGYLFSTSETFVFSRELAAVEGLVVDHETDMVTWNAVENATSYVVTIECDNAAHNHAPENVGNVTSYSLLECNGVVKFSVYPVARGYNSPEAASLTYNKVRLAVPQNVRLEGSLLKWNAVDGAAEYEVKVGDKTYKTDKTELELSAYLTEGNDYEVAVRALAGENGADSLYSNALTLSFGKISNMAYSANIVSWNYVAGATKYLVKLNDGEAFETSTNNAEVTLNQSGLNKISVCFVDKDGKQSAWGELDVTAYTMSFSVGSGKKVDPLYLATGDKVVLPETEREGYAFAGWYDAPGSSGVRYTDERFNGNANMTLYAYWAAREYTVTYEVGAGEMEETSTQVYFGQKYQLPVPTIDDLTKAFGGWYTEPNGAGHCFTDFEGVSLKAWDEVKDVKLYALWAEVLNYELLEDGESYAVKKGAATNRVKEITVPAMYDGKPVTVIDGGAFLSCSSLVRVNIPASIEVIFTGVGGTEGAASCFQGCNALQEINIYKPTDYPGAYEQLYESEDGVLIYNNPYTGKEINFYPAAKTGDFRIPDGVQVLPTNIFKYNKFTKVTIPASVTSIEKDAFRSSYNLTEVVFLPVAEGEEVKPLDIGETAFYSCSKLESITFPSRLRSLHRASSGEIDVFNSSSALMDINIDGDDGYFTSIDGVLCVNEGIGKTIFYFPKNRDGEYTIPATVVAVGEYAFKSSKIERLVIPGYVSYIAKNAFQSCTYLAEIDFQGKSNDVALTIDESAFYSCSALTELTLPANLKVLKKHAFGSTTRLKTVTVNCVGDLDFEAYAFHTTSNTGYIETLYIGSRVGLVDVNGIFGGTKLAEVNVDDRNQSYYSENGVLYDTNVTMIVYFPKGKAGNYKIPNSVRSIGTGVFKGATEIESIFINNKITTIGAEAFSGCNKLTELEFEEGGTAPLTIGDNAFYGCRGLVNVTLPKRTVSIGNSVFQNCSLMETIVLPEGLEKIGDNAFYYCSALKTVRIPSTVKEIAMVEKKEDAQNIIRIRAFDYCNKLESITVADGNENYASVDGMLFGKTNGVVTDLHVCPKLYEGVVDVPKTVNKIWPKAFYQVLGLTEVKFSEGIEGELEIGANIFYGCTALKKVALPQGLKAIGKQMFRNCEYIEEIVIPNTVESIGENAFYGCKSLTTVTFEKGGTAPLVLEDGRAESYGGGEGSSYYGAFVGCPALKKMELPERTTYIGKYAFSMSDSNASSYTVYCGLESIVIPKNVTAIAYGAFYHAKNLKSVEFQKNIDETTGEELPRASLTIDTYAFAYTALTTITIPEGVETIDWILYHAESLKTAYLPASLKVIDYTFAYCYSLENVYITDTEENPSKLELIDSSSFYGCRSLKTFTVPATVEEIDNSAFNGCSSLTTVTFADNGKLNKIGNNAFAGTGLTKFDFPTTDGIITLGTNLFQGCKSLTDVYISKSIASFNNVFAKCTSIQRVVIDEENENFTAIGNMIVNQNNTTIHLIVGAIGRGEYRIPDNYDIISARAFAGQAYITKLIIPKSVRTIQEYAFANCLGLEEVVFEEGSRLSELGSYVFENCHSLKKIALPEGLKYVSPYMFRGCSSLEEVTLPSTMWVIGGIYTPSTNKYNTTGYAFSDCSSLKKINFPEGLLAIGIRSFENCVSLEEAIFPTSLKNLGNYSFADCTSLHTVQIKSNPKENHGSGLFKGCKSLKNVSLPNGLLKLTANMFEGCSSLETLVVPSSVTDFSGGSLFKDCTSLKEIDLSACVAKKLGANMFRNCSSLKSVKLPTYINDMSGTYIFAGCTSLANLDLSACKIKTFGNNAFDGCTNLKEIKLSPDMTHLGTYAFRNCTSLERIDIPLGIKKFGTSATNNPTYSTTTYVFDGCTSLREVNLPEGFQILSAYVFRGCTSLTTFNFPSTLTTIGNYCFQNTGLTGEINLPTSVVNIGSSAFENTDITKVNIPSKLTYTGSYMFRYCDKLEEATLAKTQTTISTYMFQGCTSLTSFTFPSGLTASGIGSNAFRNTGLTGVTIPKSVASLGTSATTGAYTFADCANLTEVKFEEGSQFEKLGGYVFYNCTALENIELPKSLSVLGNYAFQNTALKDVTIPADTETIGIAPFAGCDNLTEIKVAAGNHNYEARNGALYNKTTNSLVCYPSGKAGAFTLEADAGVDKYALLGAKKVTSINIPEGVTEIPEYMFYGFESMDTIVIPASITKIGQYAFASSSIKNVIIEGTPEFGNYVFKDSQIEIVTFNDETTALGANMFQNCHNLKNITLPKALTALPNYLFDNSALTSVVIPEGVETIGSYVFRDCADLTAIDIPASVTKIDSYAFQRSGISSIVIPESVQTIGSSAFAGSAIKTAEINCTALGTSMFDDSALESIVLNDNIIALPNYMFRKCVNLKSIQLPANLQTIGTYAFQDSGLESIETPETLESIGTYAFDGCTSLKSAIIRGQLITLPNYLFCDCVNLEHVELPETIETIGTGVGTNTQLFTNCTKIKEIYFHGTAAFIGARAFENWTEDQTIYIYDDDGKMFENATAWGYGFKRYSKAKLVIIYNDEQKVVA